MGPQCWKTHLLGYPRCTSDVGWEVQDLPFSCFMLFKQLLLFSLNTFKEVIAYKAPSHIQTHIYLSPLSFHLAPYFQVVIWVVQGWGRMSVLETCINGHLKARWDFHLLLALDASFLFLSFPRTVTEILEKEKAPTHADPMWPVCISVGNMSMWGTKNLHGLWLFPAGSDAFRPALMRVWTPTCGIIATFPVNRKLTEL